MDEREYWDEIARRWRERFGIDENTARNIANSGGLFSNLTMFSGAKEIQIDRVYLANGIVECEMFANYGGVEWR